MEPEHMHKPLGNPTDVLPKRPHSRFGDDLRNFAYLRDQAVKRNKIYLALIALCVIVTVFTVCTMNYKTYVVRVDNATGAVDLGGELKSTNYQPQDAEIKHFLNQFIMQTRSIPLDPVAFRNSWKIAEHFMSKDCFNKYSQFIQRENPAAKLGKVTVQPEIKTIQIFPGTKQTYQIRWYEDEFSLSGTTEASKRKNYVGLFQVQIQPPTKESELMINPLGITIIDFNYSLENANGTTVEAGTPITQGD